MYWTTLSLFLAAESIFYPIISWLPFYSWIRFLGHLYLVLPGQQGSVFIYQNYIHPFLYEHERDIDRFITESHDKAKAAGLQYLKEGIEWVKVNMLGMQPRRPTPPASRQVSYSQSLLNRFTMPSARPEGYAAAGQPAANDIFSLLGNVMAQAAGPVGSNRSREAQAEDLSASGTLVPPNISPEERQQYISTQRDRLRTLLQAFDHEATREVPLSSSPQGSPRFNNMAAGLQDYLRPTAESLLKKSRSETEFEEIGHDDLTPPASRKGGPGQGMGSRNASWSKWIWGNYGEKDSAAQERKDQ